MKRLIIILGLWVASIAPVAFADTYAPVTGFYYLISTIRSTFALACVDVGKAGYPYPFLYDSTLTRCVETWDGTSNFASGNIRASQLIQQTPYCPGGGTLLAGQCINAPACVAPQIRNSTTGICTAPAIIACPSGHYAPLGSTSTVSCVSIPNCNAQTPVDGQFFNINTAQCEISTAITLCISGVEGQTANYYCPSVNDCLPASAICSNNAVDTATAAASRAADLVAIKAAADDKRTQAEAAAQTAQTAAAAKEAAKQAAQTAAAAAKAASDAVAASAASTPKSISDAAAAYLSAASDYTTLAAKAANSALAAAAALTAAGDAINHVNAIPAANPGNATVYGGMVDTDLGKALTAANDAISGLGSGTGTGQGVSAGNCEETGSCSASAVYSATPSTRSISDSFSLVSAKFRSKLPTVVFSDIEPECPVFTQYIPFLETTFTIDAFCTMDSMIRPPLQAVSLFIYALMAFFIILRA